MPGHAFIFNNFMGLGHRDCLIVYSMDQLMSVEAFDNGRYRPLVFLMNIRSDNDLFVRLVGSRHTISYLIVLTTGPSIA